MRKGIAIAGNMIVDTVKTIDAYPPAQALANIRSETKSTGGLACNCLRVLAKLDLSLPLKAIGIVGEDAAGDFLLAQLAQHPSIDCSGIRREGITSYTDVMTQIQDGTRTFFHFRGANALLSPAHFDCKKLDAKILHIGYILLLDSLDAPDPKYPCALCRVLHDAQKAGIATSVDVVSENSARFSKLVPPALRYTDYCIINEWEAARTTGIPLRTPDGILLRESLPTACRALMDMGVRQLVVLHMPECACGLTHTGEYCLVPSLQLPEGFIASSVGAGDAFASGILYGLYHGWDLQRNLRSAAAIAAISLSGTGASDAILPLEDLMRRMSAYAHSENNVDNYEMQGFSGD